MLSLRDKSHSLIERSIKLARMRVKPWDSKAGRLTYKKRACKLSTPSFDDAGHLLDAGEDGGAGLENISRID